MYFAGAEGVRFRGERPDNSSETFRVLKRNEIKRFCEYHTARLVLGAWERLERGELI
jgi:hypothetical protein